MIPTLCVLPGMFVIEPTVWTKNSQIAAKRPNVRVIVNLDTDDLECNFCINISCI